VRFAIEVDDDLACRLGFEEELESDYKHASTSRSRPAARARARATAPPCWGWPARWLVDERGHDRITIDRAAHNDRAIRAFGAVAFRAVGIMRR
jgi:aminoglycoside 6'-N-acetyltransferase